MKRVAIKTALMLIISLAILQTTAAQDPVADATLQLINAQVTAQTNINSSQLTQIASTTTQATATASTVANTLQYLKEIESKLQMVNSVLTTAIYVKNITTREKEILQMQKEITSYTHKMTNLTPEELQSIDNNLLTAVQTTSNLIKLTDDLLKSKTYRMDDGERLNNFLTIDKQLAIQESIMRATYEQYSIINEERVIDNSIQQF